MTTYGLKEAEDIESMLKFLIEYYGHKKFVLWGRSMGAVASILYTCSPDYNKKPIVDYQVLDSPFSSFETMAKYWAR